MANFDGYGSTKSLEPRQKCPKCQKTGGVHYRGSEVLHGNPYTPAADTDVRHHYECEKCGHKWSMAA